MPGGLCRDEPFISLIVVLFGPRYLALTPDSVSTSGDTFSHSMEMSVRASAIMTLVAWHTSMREKVPTGSGAGQPRVKTINAYMAFPRDKNVCYAFLRANFVPTGRMPLSMAI